MGIQKETNRENQVLLTNSAPEITQSVREKIVRKVKSKSEVKLIQQIKALIKDKEFKKAEEVGKILIQLNPTLVEGYYFTAIAQAQQERTDELLKTLELLSESDENFKKALIFSWNSPSEDPTEKNKDVLTEKQVRTTYETIFKEKKYFYYYKGWTYSSKFEFSKAFPLFLLALKDNPLSLDEFFNLKKNKNLFNPWIVISESEMILILNNLQFNNFILNYFGEENRIKLDKIKKDMTQSHNEEILPYLDHDDSRVSPEFAHLGPMIETEQKIIWSAVVPEKMDQKNAAMYCQNLGGGAQLPSQFDFKKSYSFLRGGKFWSRSWYRSWGQTRENHTSPYACYYDAITKKIGQDLEGHYPRSFFCVVYKRSWNQWKNHPLIKIKKNDLNLTPQFAALGDIYQAVDLIWSWISPVRMDWETAKVYCNQLKEGSRLPSSSEWENLAKWMHTDIHKGFYNPDLFPGMNLDEDRSNFWSSDLELSENHSKDSNSKKPLFFNGNNGKTLPCYSEKFVRCVIDFK